MSSGDMQLRTQANEFVKQFIEYDLADRMSVVYAASSGAKHGAVCSKVTYEYRAPASSQVLKMKEEEATWDSSWDI